MPLFVHTQLDLPVVLTLGRKVSSVPLSAFGRVDGRFVLVGALSRAARAEDVAHEVAVLSDNALDALDALAEFLR